MRNRVLQCCIGLAIFGAGTALGIVVERQFRWGQDTQAGAAADQQARKQAEQEEIKEAVIDDVFTIEGNQQPKFPRPKAFFIFDNVDQRKDGRTIVLGWAAIRSQQRNDFLLYRFWYEVKRDDSGNGWKVERIKAELHRDSDFEPPPWRK